MAAYLVEHGPLAIAADAAEWQFYFGGVFDLPCGKSLDHGILIVGFGNETTIFGFHTQYWIVKNSWYVTNMLFSNCCGLTICVGEQHGESLVTSKSSVEMASADLTPLFLLPSFKLI